MEGGAVHEQKHHDDEADRDDRDVVQAGVGDGERVGGQGSRAADVDLEAGWRRVLLDDVADGGHGLVGLYLTDVAGETQEHIGALAIHALRPRGGEQFAPQNHHVLHVPGVALKAAHQIVVVPVVLATQRPVGLEHHHGQVGRIGFVELFTDVQQRPL